MTKSRAGLRRRERDCVYVCLVEAIYSTWTKPSPGANLFGQLYDAFYTFAQAE
jgi:hypothetical protein